MKYLETINREFLEMFWSFDIRILVSVHRFRVQRSALPLAAKAASLITKVTLSCGVIYEG